MKTPSFSIKLLHPRYWLLWFGLGFMALVAQLPFRWQMVLGVRLGRLAHLIAQRRRQIALRNIELCFPDWSQTEREQFIYRHFETMGIAIMEMGMSWFMSSGRLEPRFELKGLEHITRLNAKGQGAVILGGHFNALEICHSRVARAFNLYATYRPHDNAVFDFIQVWGRERHNPETRVVDRYDIRGMVKAIKQGDFLWYAPDQDFGRRVSEFVPFFGIDAATVAATPKLLRLAKAQAVPVVFRRNADLTGYVIEFFAPLNNLPSGDDGADLVRLNQFFEQQVLANPLEYLWSHRRFKTRPEGEPNLYAKITSKRKK